MRAARHGPNMATTQSAAVETFVEAAREAMRTETDVREQARLVAAAAEELLAADGWFEDAVDFDGDREKVVFHEDQDVGHPDPGFVVRGSVTPPAVLTGGNTPHDHGASFVVYGVYEGQMEQTRYTWDYGDDVTDPQLTESMQYVQTPGEASFILPGEIHRTNIVSDGPTWVVRIESQDLADVARHHYDPDENLITKG